MISTNFSLGILEGTLCVVHFEFFLTDEGKNNDKSSWQNKIFERSQLMEPVLKTQKLFCPSMAFCFARSK